MDLFADDSALMPIPIEDGELWFQQRLALDLAPPEAMQRLLDETDWRAEQVQVWGKLHMQPRLTAWHGEASYRYSGKTFHPLPFTPLQLHIKQAVERATGRQFNSVLLNYYRDERDSMGFHADDERELGPQPAIASVSFGAPRTFILKHRRLPKTIKLALGDGCLLLMAGSLQLHWLHGINKERGARGPRINLTFRQILREP
ncbi:alpha-ketoglutarate-dependent dioxygenase AlkB family protein [Duganella violaceipulchra]|uniref:Alkylated DNA repair dioxygenase AlkB n=1 Tax=Duganella violaceipulchra TaxID=2849652 RepID=A0AA41H5K5_9BURK|nr:alpha-ketoglutarate-dependent dioxygenase AlkB [Duganella violaceicalia]MBV6320640.1 alpha-ketoglutarate-dependent dioxygenase AlkB [Duganella violaceicalia]MCP2008649.1 alkylated DNA repair dioxygenase AlkB [Duganella violaceicalia]